MILYCSQASQPDPLHCQHSGWAGSVNAVAFMLVAHMLSHQILVIGSDSNDPGTVLTSLCEVMGESGFGKQRTSCTSVRLSCPGSISGARARAARCRTAWGPAAVQRCTMAWRWAGLYFLLLMLLVEGLHGEGRESVAALTSFNADHGAASQPGQQVSGPQRKPERAGR